MGDYEEPVQFNGVGSISHLNDVRSRKRKQPLGFVPPQTKAKPKKRTASRKAKR